MSKRGPNVESNSPDKRRKIMSWKDKFIEAFDYEEKKILLHKLKDIKGISKATPIDEHGNSVLNFIIENSELCILRDVLKIISADDLNKQNYLGETILHTLLEKKPNRIIIKALLDKGANPQIPNKQGVCASDLIKNKPILKSFLETSARKLDDYIDARELLTQSVIENSILETIEALQKNGFALDEPIIDDDESILHWLIIHAPLYILKEILEKNSAINVDMQNIHGETSLMIAANLGRQLAVNLLIAYGANPSLVDNFGLRASDHASRVHVSIEFTNNPSQRKTVYEYLLEYPAKKIHSLSGTAKIEYLFNKFIKLIGILNWRYDGDYIDYKEKFLLDCDVTKGYIVNCFSLSDAFVFFLRAHGILHARTEVYKNIKSIPFVSKGDKIKGEFICFDKEAHSIWCEKEGYFHFVNHCVVKCENRFYDPTFRCHYDNREDIVDPDPNATIEFKEYIEANISIIFNDKDHNLSSSMNIMQNTMRKKQMLFNLPFLGKVFEIFKKDDWKHLQRETKLFFVHQHGNERLEINLKNIALLTFYAEDLSSDIFCAIIHIWKQSLPQNITIHCEIDSNLPSLGKQTKEHLSHYGIDSTIVNEDEEKDDNDVANHSLVIPQNAPPPPQFI